MDQSATSDVLSGASATDQPPPVSVAGGIEPGARTFVWSVLVLMMVFDLAYILKYSPRVPIYDDYEMVPSYTREQPITLDWLWSQSNEHRVFLPRLIHVLGFRISGGDFRFGNFVSLASLVCASGFLVEIARRRRGYPRYSDAFFPLILLSLGQWDNLIWSWEIVHVVPPAIACVLLGLIVLRPTWPTAIQSIPFAIALILLPLFSGTGLCLTPPLLGWLLISSLMSWRSARPGGKLQGALILAMTLPVAALVILYFKGYSRPTYIPERGTPREIFMTMVGFLNIGFGSASRLFWPQIGLGVLGILGFAGLVLTWAVIWKPSERPRALGLLAFLASCGALSLAVGINRSGFGAGYAGMADRYVTPSIPILCWAYFVLDLYGPAITRRLFPPGLCLAAIMLFLPNFQDAREKGRERRDRFSEYENDVRNGMSTYQIARRHSMLIFGSDPTTYLESLRSAGIRPFDRIRKNPVFKEVTLPVAPSAFEHAGWDEATKTILVEGRDSRVTFTLPEPMKLAGIRLNYTFESAQGGGTHFVVDWRASENETYSKDRMLKEHSVRLGTGQNLTGTMWVDDLVKQFRIEPDDRPGKFQIHSITLLIP